MSKISRTKRVVIKQRIVNGKVVEEEVKTQIIEPAKPAEKLVFETDFDEVFKCVDETFEKLLKKQE